MKKIVNLLILLLLFVTIGINAQVTIGNLENPHTGAVLHLKSGNSKGLLLPVVSLSSVNTFDLDEDADNPASSATGMVVFNTNESISGGNGIGTYVWDGKKWMHIGDGSTPSINPVKTISISGDDRVDVGNSSVYSATITPANATNKTVIWTVSNGTGSASIEALSGKLTGISSGTVYVYATAIDGSGISSLKEVIINPVPVTGITIIGSSTVATGSSVTLDVEITPSNASNKEVTWSVINGTGSAVIDATRGILLGVSAGNVTVVATAKDGSGISAVKTITVETTDIKVSSITISGPASVNIGEYITLTVSVLPVNATNTGITWSVTNGTGSATINSTTGVLTGVTAGSVTVTATAQDGSGKTASYPVMVNSIGVTQIIISGAEDFLSGTATTLTTTVFPENTENKSIIWSIDRTDIATISNTGVLSGTASFPALITVTATSAANANISATKQVVVYGSSIIRMVQSTYVPTYSSTYLNIADGSNSSVFLNYFEKTNKTLYAYTIAGYSSLEQAIKYLESLDENARLPNLAEASILVENQIFANPTRQFPTSDLASGSEYWRIDMSTHLATKTTNDQRFIYQGIVSVWSF